MLILLLRLSLLLLLLLLLLRPLLRPLPLLPAREKAAAAAFRKTPTADRTADRTIADWAWLFKAWLVAQPVYNMGARHWSASRSHTGSPHASPEKDRDRKGG
jgi:hypothetical protein